ncbi:MAG: hypothetical protein A2Z57_11025 [Planctomycetes bacterium RIFCSPHIGHO2_12_39_6]|nr:MAG: hypothetical protein A2Z57_11025 [Planctomycetes bacterium RIFCSPHIGHO2_12_39_6]
MTIYYIVGAVIVKDLNGSTERQGVKSLQVVRECIYATETILYIGRTFVSKQYIVYIDWSNFILGQPVN